MMGEKMMRVAQLCNPTPAAEATTSLLHFERQPFEEGQDEGMIGDKMNAGNKSQRTKKGSNEK